MILFLTKKIKEYKQHNSNNMSQNNIKSLISISKWKIIRDILLFSFFIFVIGVIADMYTEKENIINSISDKVANKLDENNDNFDYYSDESEEPENCNVRRIEIEGSFVTYLPSDAFYNGDLIYDIVPSDWITRQIKDAQNEEKIKAILVEIDSGGGSPTAGYEIMKALKDFTKTSTALIRETGASSAYLASTGANHIIASKYSDVGSIGVTSSFLDNVKYNQKEGYTYNQIIAGQYKDLGDPDKPLTQKEKELPQRDVNIVYENFISDVAINRNLSVDDVRKLADGNTMLGESALQNKLIDELGGETEAIKYLKDKIGEEVIMCE